MDQNEFFNFESSGLGLRVRVREWMTINSTVVD